MKQLSMTSKICLIFLWVFIIPIVYASQPKALLVLDGNPSLPYPPNYRSTFDLSTQSKQTIDSQGLKNLHVIGSGQFSEQQLKNIIQHISNHILVIDLRRESHGFINGIPCSWYGQYNWENRYKTPKDILFEEQRRLHALSLLPKVIIYEIKGKTKQDKINAVWPIVLVPKQVSTEAQLVHAFHLQYYRIFVNDHQPPTKQQVKNLVKLLKKLPPDTWIYFHCRAGKGRTTTFMVIYDIIKNASLVSFDDILKRQAAIGGKNLARLPPASS